MIRYAVIIKANAPEQLPSAPVQWEFTVGEVAYIGLEWGDGDTVPALDSWEVFKDSAEFSIWKNNQTQESEQWP